MPDAAHIAEWTVTHLQTQFAGGKPLVLLDVRRDDERAHARIAPPPGVVDLHVPLDQLPARVAEITESTAQGVPCVVYCHLGQRSLVAATWLAQHGVGEACNLTGGIEAWSIRVDPTVPRY